MPNLPGDTFLFQRPSLLITWPDGTRQTYPLERTAVRIGRGVENNDLVTPDEFKSISRNHLEIRRQGAVCLAVDLGSANGVYINGERIETSVPLQDGDEIRIGSEGEEIRVVFVQGTAETFVDFSAAGEISPQESEFQTHPPEGQPHLKIHWPDGSANYFILDQPVTRLGRAADCGLILPARLRFVSNHHAEIRRTDSGFTLIDLNSSNGTRLNNQSLEPGVPALLRDEAIIRIGDERFGVSIGFTFYTPGGATLQVAGYAPAVAAPTLLSETREISIGRDDQNDLVLRSPKVSRRHARIRQTGENYWIEDLGSTNGTFVNNQIITDAELHNGDLITLGDHILVFQDGQLSQYQSHGIRVDVLDLCKDLRTRSGPLRILHNIDMTVLPREFVAVVGGSGAGKSTLMNALIGFRPGEGQVLLNGYDFYDEYEHFRAQLGYVPQADILHTSLTVEKALDYAARLRLPPDIRAAERAQRIAEVLETVSMNTPTIRQTRISNLSGGQRKRVSIAAELLADPKLIYLDEATSGLDPGLEKKMMHTLRRMADEGRTVILITHATANIVQTDHVAFLSQGRLVYFGPSQDALDFFDVDDFADIYERIERHGEEWQQIFHQTKPERHQTYVIDRQATKPVPSRRDLPKIRFGLRNMFRQFSVLTRRAFSVLMSDWFTLILMLLLFPLTATLQLMIASPDILVGNAAILADPVAAARTLAESYIPFADLNTFIFVMGLEAVLVGMYVPSNELIKERNVYLREHMVNLKVLPYLFSKIAVFTLFAAIQTFLYLVVLSLGVDLPDQGLYFSAPLEIFITLFLTMLAGMGIGFVVSAVSRSSDMAIYVLVILLFFQFFFAGTVFDLRENAAEPLSYLTTTRWSLTALGASIGMEDQVSATVICNPAPDNPLTSENEAGRMVCFNYPEATDDLMLPYGDEQLARSWIILMGMAVAALTVTGILIRRLDR